MKIKIRIFVFNSVFPESRAVYEIMWRNMVESDRQQMAIRRMRFLRLMTKDTHTNTLRICNTYCFSTETVVTRTQLKCSAVRTLPVFF